MRPASHVFVYLSAIFMLFSCQDHRREIKHIQQAALYVSQHPENAKIELDSIGMNVFILNPKWRAQYIYVSCLTADKLEIDFPSVNSIMEAKEWYEKRGTTQEKVIIKLYLGRVYVKEKKQKEAMKELLEALAIAKKAKLYNEAGYISSHLADIYINHNDTHPALSKYEESAAYFLQAGNMRSYGYANRDIGRTYFYEDSLQLALVFMQRADSVATLLSDKEMKTYVYNGFGNIYKSLKNYPKAEEYLQLALLSDTGKISPTHMAISNLYIQMHDYRKAEAMLDTLYAPDLSEEYQQSILNRYYLIHAGRNNPEKALSYFEQYYKIFEKRILETTDTNFREMEKKYDLAVLQTSVQQLTISHQKFINALAASFIIILSLIAIYQHKRIRSNRLLHKKDMELKNLNSQILDLKYRLEEEEKKLQSLTEKEADYQVKESEIAKFKKELFENRQKKMQHSELRNKLLRGSKPNDLTKQITLDEKLWYAIEEEIESIYPDFRGKLFTKHPNLGKSDFLYCCLSLFNLDINQEAILLKIDTPSVSKRRTRIRQTMGVSFADSNIHTYLTNIIIHG